MADIRKKGACGQKKRIDLYSFGQEMPGRTWQGIADAYRYGMNGKEKANEITEGDFDFGDRIVDSRIGRWLSVDQLRQKYPFMSPYNFGLNNPISFIDPDGKVVTPADDRAKMLYNNLKIALQNSTDEKSKIMLCQLETMEKNPEVNYKIFAGEDIKYHENSEAVKGVTRFDFENSTEDNAIVNIYINKNTDKTPSEAYEALGDELSTAYQFDQGDIGFTEKYTDDRDPNPNGSFSYDSKDEYNSKVGSMTAVDAMNELGENKYTKSEDVEAVSKIERSNKTESQKNDAIDTEITPILEKNGYSKSLEKDSNGKTRKAADAKPAESDRQNLGTNLGGVKQVAYRKNNTNGNKETKIEKPQ